MHDDDDQHALSIAASHLLVRIERGVWLQNVALLNHRAKSVCVGVGIHGETGCDSTRSGRFSVAAPRL